MTRYFYSRCSTADQCADRQEDEAKRQGIEPENYYCDKISGAKRSRPALDEMLSKLKDGDTVVCLSLDRLSRSTKDLLDLMELFQKQGVNLISLHEGIDTSTNNEVSKLIFTVFSAVAEFQRNTILRNCAEGRKSKIEREGHCGGRKPLPASTKKAICDMKRNGSSIKEICEALNVSKASIYRVWNNEN